MPISSKHLAGVTLNSMRWRSVNQINRNTVFIKSTSSVSFSGGAEVATLFSFHWWEAEAHRASLGNTVTRDWETKIQLRLNVATVLFKTPFNCVLWLQKHSPIYPVDIILQTYRRECILLMSPEVPTLSPYLILLFTLFTGFPEFKR